MNPLVDIHSSHLRTQAHASADGDGVQIKRIAGFKGAKALDPFLMLDELRSNQPGDYIGGFPPHPHRGFETVTYLKAGKLRHRDHLGNSGLIVDGGAQWMVAGSGVIHSEMPEQTEGLLHGFQLWLNLPAKEKMQPPRYRDLAAADLPKLTSPGGQITLIAGPLALDGEQAKGPIGGQSSHPLLADLTWAETVPLNLTMEEDLSLYLYCYQGAVHFGDEAPLEAGELAFLDPGQRLSLQGSAGSGALLLGGQALKEPVAHYGPFVMNTQEEIEEAVRAYNQDRLTEASSKTV